MEVTYEEMDKKARRRLYDRRKQNKKVDEVKRLRNIVQVLMAKASKLKYFKQSMLPWKDIAIELGRETAESFESNRMLRGDLFQVENLAIDMGRWVATMTQAPSIPRSPVEKQHFSLRYTSLPKSESARHLGFDWITKHLFHNLQHAVDHCHFPATHDPYFSVMAEPLDDTHVISHAAQRVEPVPYHVAVQCMRTMILQFPGSIEELDPTMPDMTYLRYKAAVGPNEYFENTLMREFHELDRYTIVVHIISEDDKHPVTGVRRNWTQWVRVEPVGDTHAVIRQGMTWFGLRTQDRYLALEESTTFGPRLAQWNDIDQKLNAYARFLEERVKHELFEERAEFHRLAREIQGRGIDPHVPAQH
ncbi:hypothetical protein H310_11224 [Aphanomyces invadans]|uniref:START domain-containing protein n=1 Tax=Aphanomyces invadans TaxID=157072 RepID=A0A024TPQ9_9STRA|nr:hypothetical protein H310_11224 [Aphanomyces invadans]ETV95327.1 hypothetical protein H310_11224 [Aphanomyces invadans]|eukprot:XP_008876028.1 hypothetical protein H310_11224 [Aphanomyces invadans]